MDKKIFEKGITEGFGSCIDVSIVKVCKKIRQLAKLERIRVEIDEQIEGINKHFVEYVEYSGLGMSAFMKRYLSNLQPFMIKSENACQNGEVYFCEIDYVYKIAVEIESGAEPLEEVVVSFSNKGSCNTSATILPSDKRNIEMLPVFADSICSKIVGENRYVVNVFIQRGLGILPLQLWAQKCNDVFLVKNKYIDMGFKKECDNYLRTYT